MDSRHVYSAFPDIWRPLRGRDARQIRVQLSDSRVARRHKSLEWSMKCVYWRVCYSSICWMLWRCHIAHILNYNHAFYLNQTGYIDDIFERATITNGGYLCKKFKTASHPPTVGYNLAYCFPSLGSAGACPTDWTSYNPGSQNFCYYVLNSYAANHDEIYRQCHALGADLAYLESWAEGNMMLSNSWITGSSQYVAFGGNRFRYGSTFSWSSGTAVTNSFHISWGGSQPDDACSTESALQFVAGSWLNDITAYIFRYFNKLLTFNIVYVHYTSYNNIQ